MPKYFGSIDPADHSWALAACAVQRTTTARRLAQELHRNGHALLTGALGAVEFHEASSRVWSDARLSGCESELYELSGQACDCVDCSAPVPF